MRAEKQYLISEVESHLKKSDYVILANFSKVTVADVAEIRSQLAAEKAEYHVVKNSSLRVAAKALGLPEIESGLTGPTAVVVGGKNPAGVAKVLKKFFDEKKKLEVKVGVIDRKIITAGELSRSRSFLRSTYCAPSSSACSRAPPHRSFVWWMPGSRRNPRRPHPDTNILNIKTFRRGWAFTGPQRRFPNL